MSFCESLGSEWELEIYPTSREKKPLEEAARQFLPSFSAFPVHAWSNCLILDLEGRLRPRK